VAVQEGFLEARFDLAHDILQRQKTEILLALLADEDHLSAQMELIKRYREGDGLEKDNAKAFYWVFRAMLTGVDMSEQHRRLSKTLSEAELAQVTSWFTSSTFPGQESFMDYVLDIRSLQR
jgi:TPR repeat protein